MLDPYIGAYELRDLVLRKEVRPREIAEFFLARIERLNPRLGAFMTITGERALRTRRASNASTRTIGSRCPCSASHTRSRT